MQEVVCGQTQCKFIWIQPGEVGFVVTQLFLGLKAKQNVEEASTSDGAVTGRKDLKPAGGRKESKEERIRPE